jgi:CubicO group peptidase (beta-lactamase class C family)
MNKRIPVGALAVVLWGLDAHHGAQGASSIAPDVARKIDELFTTWDTTRSPGCSVGISRGGTVVYARSFGMSNLEYDVAITPDSVFQVGSISKQFTAFAIALLANDGKLSLDDDIRRYLPELPDYGQTITIRHLLAHTGAFRDFGTLLRRAGWRPDDVVTEDDMLLILARQKSLNAQPGAEFLYSNTGYTLLAFIVKRVAGQSFRDFAQARIFTPLGMRDSQVRDDHSMLVRRRTSAYEPRPGGGWRISLPVFDVPGATNVYTTIGDLLKWEQNLIDGKVGGKALAEDMQVSGRLADGTVTGYGNGLLMETYRGVRTVNHSGSDAGYRANAVLLPDHDLAVVAMCNLSSINARVLTFKIAEVVLGPDVFQPRPPTVSMSRAEIERLEGTYWNAHYEEVWKILVRDGKLAAEGNPDYLVSLGDGRFRLGEQTTEFKFTVSKTAVSLAVSAPVLTPAVFERVTAPAYSGAELQAYAGQYHSDELDTDYTVSVTPTRSLSVQRRKYDPTLLDAVKDDVFTGRSLGTVTFVHSPSGEVTGFTISAGRTHGVAFTRAGDDRGSRK